MECKKIKKRERWKKLQREKKVLTIWKNVEEKDQFLYNSVIYVMEKTYRCVGKRSWSLPLLVTREKNQGKGKSARIWHGEVKVQYWVNGVIDTLIKWNKWKKM